MGALPTGLFQEARDLAEAVSALTCLELLSQKRVPVCELMVEAVRQGLSILCLQLDYTTKDGAHAEWLLGCLVFSYFHGLGFEGELIGDGQVESVFGKVLLCQSSSVDES